MEFNSGDGGDERIRRLLAGRNYAPVVHRMVHFAVAAERVARLSPTTKRGAPQGMLAFLSHPQAFTLGFIRQYFSTPCLMGGYVATFATRSVECQGHDPREGSLWLEYSKATGDSVPGTFMIHWEGVSLLTAMAEFLCYGMGFESFLRRIQQVLDAGPTMQAIGALANEFNRHIYQRLGEMGVDRAQQLRKYHFIRDWMLAYGASQGLDEGRLPIINDPLVLAFWADCCKLDSDKNAGLSFGSLANVVDSIVDFMAAQYGANTEFAVTHSTSLGHDVEAGEVSDELLVDTNTSAFANLNNEMEFLNDLLTAPLNQIKVVNKKEADMLASVLDFGQAKTQLPLSVLRKAVVGTHQSRITEALRRKNTVAHLLTLGAADLAYDDYVHELEALSAQLQKTLLAILHALLTLQDADAIAILTYLYPSLKLQHLANITGQDLPEDEGAEHLLAAIAARFFQTLAEERLQNPVFNSVVREAEAAWKATNREGFKQALLPDDERLPSFKEAATRLQTLLDILRNFHHALTQSLARQGGVTAVSAADLSIISGIFQMLYGAHDE
jgi:hypothetical protein